MQKSNPENPVMNLYLEMLVIIINDILHDEIRRLKEECIDLTTFNLKTALPTPIACYGILCVPVQS